MAPVRYRWDAKNRKVIDTGPSPLSAIVVPKDYAATADKLEAFETGLIEALKQLRTSEPGRILADLMSDHAYREEFDEGLRQGREQGMASAFGAWWEDYVAGLTLMFKALAVLFGDVEAATLVTATMVYELAMRPMMEKITGLDLPPAWNNPKVKRLMLAVRAEAKGEGGELVQPEFRRFVRSVLSIVAMVDLLRTGVRSPGHAIFLLGVSESSVAEVEQYMTEWKEALTTRSVLVTELMLQMNGQPGDQGATIGYWMGATVVNTVRAGVEELARFASPLG
jgi:hypothetical protein